MANLITIKINGTEHKVPEGVNLIDAAQGVGVHIPNFCYLKGMKGIGACRMCLVEVNGRSMTACIMKTKDGMDVVTDSEKVKEARKFVVDLILSMHPLDCMTCTKAGVCELQNYAYDFEIKDSSFTRKKFGFPIDDKNPFIKRDPDYCILCGRCVRVCKEQGTSVLEFYGRGVGSKVTTAADKPLHESDCTFCGSCLDVCPVNAIVEADRWRKGREWQYENTESVCLYCAGACDIKVSTYKGDVAKVCAGGDDALAEHFICALGRYGFDSLNAETRVLNPLKKVGGKLQETTWADAAKIVSDKIKGAGSGILTVSSITNEDTLAMKGYYEAAGVEHLAASVSSYSDKASLIGDAVDVEGADLMIVVGLNPNQWTRFMPSIDALIRTKADRKTKLVVINSDDAKIAEIADVVLSGDEASLLKSLAKAIAAGLALPAGLDVLGASVSEDITKAAELFKNAESPVVITTPQLYQAAANLSLFKGGAVSVGYEANSKGITLMGLQGKGVKCKEMIGGKASSLLTVGNGPLPGRPKADFWAAIVTNMTDVVKEADVVLPMAAFLEVSGTIVDYQGRLKKLSKTVEPLGQAKPVSAIFTELAKAAGKDITVNASEIESLAKETIKVKAAPFEKRTDIEAMSVEIEELINAHVVNGSRLFWLKEVQKAALVG
ncbi:molybdopterin-dependent oxidoreductase [Candidatus Magnetomonas plexicatena]|uniref:molybdopterin-dependent oxidoreductase n=1 Tax=Candidatus Magnetomonas plexicatena TaxID=2552947 RepID=UPI001C7694BA|nr:molybdopterin-dependent oxidoreductase [Nitrospirales bacterium LBB_01]